MDPTGNKTVNVALSPGDISPWLRVAHIWESGSDDAGRYMLRSLLDFELVFQLEGEDWFEFPWLNGGVSVKKNMIALIPPGALHSQALNPKSKHIAIHFDLQANKALKAFDMIQAFRGRKTEPSGVILSPPPITRISYADSSEDLLIPMLIKPAQSEIWRDRFMQLVDMWSLGEQDLLGSQMKFTSILTSFFASFELKNVSMQNSAEARIKEFLAHLNAMPLWQPWSVAKMANYAGLSESRFRVVFKEVTGTVPRAYLENLRISGAARLLRETSGRIGDIAKEVGYADQMNFSKAFRRVMGCMPRDYRSGQPDETNIGKKKAV